MPTDEDYLELLFDDSVSVIGCVGAYTKNAIGYTQHGVSHIIPAGTRVMIWNVTPSGRIGIHPSFRASFPVAMVLPENLHKFHGARNPETLKAVKPDDFQARKIWGGSLLG
jgi:hypothetical protein